jgi:hypothetical protein
MPPRRNPTTEPNALEIGDGNIHPEPVDIPVDETTLPGSQVMGAISQLVSALDCNRVARQPAESTGCSLKDLCGHHSESFDGRGVHIYVENWLNDVEELLATLGCMNEQNVAYAAYKLTEQDKKVVLVANLGLETAISWKVFKHEFNQYFFPRVV